MESSTDTSCSVGYRTMSKCALVEKVRQFAATRAWPQPGQAQAQITLWQSDAEAESDGDQQQRRTLYLSGHHRGCALHALLRFHYSAGRDLPTWLAKLAAEVPASMSSVKKRRALANTIIAQCSAHTLFFVISAFTSA